MDNLNTKLFTDRIQAGKELAKRLKKYAGEDTIVLALPRGGVPVGYETAKVLHVPLDVIITRKLGLPGHEEYGIGAISEGDSKILDQKTLSSIGLPAEYLEGILSKEKIELDRRRHLYRQDKPLPDLKNKIVILVDDGLATGVTARASIEAIKKQKPKKIIFASPVCAYQTVRELAFLADEVVCIATPLELWAVGLWYQNFPQLSDREVIEFLTKSKHSGESHSTLLRNTCLL